MAKKQEIEVQGTIIRLYSEQEKDFICITDIAKQFEVGVTSIESWMRNRNTVEFLGTWELLKNPNFNSVGFDGIKQNVGLNTFKISVKKWIEATNAIGIQSKAGRYGGTYAHKDIAMQFCYWLSPVFQLYVIQEFDRLKSEEAKRLESDWNIRRELAKITYPLQQTAIKERLIPARIKSNVVGAFYASEADLINVAVFGMTAKDWRSQNPNLKGNLRDFATHEQLVVVNTLQSHNAHLIRNGLPQEERLEILNEIAIYEMQVLLNTSAAMNRLKDKNME
ncbi:MAG: KilA-N domain-containing protein [Saprospiraceae bacterium]|nr:KilA-N domain-containing protein [Saprospiraceae bacterium]